MAEVSLEMIQTLLLRSMEEQRELHEEFVQMRKDIGKLQSNNDKMLSLVLTYVDSSKRLEHQVIEMRVHFERRFTDVDKHFVEVEKRISDVKAEVVEGHGRLERRVSEVKDDVELMLKAEIMGTMGHYRNTIDTRMEILEARIPLD